MEIEQMFSHTRLLTLVAAQIIGISITAVRQQPQSPYEHLEIATSKQVPPLSQMSNQANIDIIMTAAHR